MTPEIEPLLPRLKSLIEDHVTKAVDPERRQQLAEVRRNHAYWTANQYVVPVVYDQQIVDYRSATGDLRYPGNVPDTAYDYCMNQIRGDGKKLIAVLGQRSPHVKAVPDKLDDDQAVRVASKINDLLARLRALWKVEKVQRRLALSIWKSGTTFGHVRWVASGHKYGYDEVPQMETTEEPDGPGSYVCSACGTPSPEMGACPCGKFLQPEEFQPPQMVPVTKEVGPPTRYPKGAPELTLETIAHVCTPFYSEGVETLPWLRREYEEHQAVILAAYSDGNHPYAMKKLLALRDKPAAQGGSDLGQVVRDSISSPSASFIAPRPDRWNFVQYWLTPEMFMFIREDTERESLQAAFPNGMKLTMVQDEPIDAINCRLPEEWSVCFPEPNESMFPDPLCKDYMGIQDLVNDVLNITVETAERAIPITFYDPSVISKKFWKENAPAPGTMTPSVPNVGSRLRDAVLSVSTSDLNGQLLAWSDSLISRARENVGAIPALFGGETPVQTAYQASRQLNQALMQLSPVWNEMRSFWEQTYRNGVRSLITYSDDARDLPMDGWHLEVEEAIPMTWGQIRDFFTMLLERGPDAWQMFGLTDPANLSIVHTALGLQGWKLREQEEREHILDMVRQLLRAAPVQPPIDPLTGAPLGPLQASVPPDDLEFDPMLVVKVVREWLQGEDAQMAREQAPEGYANVLAWTRAFMQMLMPPPMLGGPEGGPAPPDGGKEPGGESPPAGATEMAPPTPAPPSVSREPLPGPNTPLPR